MITIHRRKPQYSEVTEKNNYGQYKDDLSSDFYRSCGYCDSPDFVWGGKSGFQIDHFAPKSKFPELANDYKNLVYSCPICNRGKSNYWPSKESSVSVKGNKGFVHPCTDEYEEHLGRDSNGEIISKTELGKYIHQTMKFGLSRHQIIWLREELNLLIIEVKAYIDKSSKLKERYIELLEGYKAYDEILRQIIDDRSS